MLKPTHLNNMKKTFLFAFVVIAFAFAAAAFAQTADKISYPVAELGGCKDKADCKAYCDKPENITPCMSFAKQNGLMTEKEIKVAEEFASGEINGPGGCKTKDACEEYCNDMSRIDECIKFAEENNLMPSNDLAEAKKIQAAIKQGVKPPSCKNKKECDAYCDDPSHMQECIEFASKAGFMQGKELEDAQKMLLALKKGVKPPPCKGKEECDAYCQTPENMEVCMNFAMEAGFMTEEEKANSQKMIQALKKGVKPPACKGKEECDAYCQSDEHMQECIDFSVAAGMMSEEDAKMAKKTGGKGPGGCKGKEECEAFCQNPDNQETCFNFGRDNGMIPQEDLKKMEEGKQQMKQTLEKAPAELIECLNAEIGADMVAKMKNGYMPPKDMGDKMQTCFGKMGRGEGGPGEGGMMGPEGQAGPGGCKSPEECDAYCKDHQEECAKIQQGRQNNPGQFQPGPGQENPGGQMMPQQAGPGGCKSPEECGAPSQQPQMQPGTQGGPSERQIQGQPGSSVPCEGPNCQNAPPPPGPMQPGDQPQSQPGDQLPQMQPGTQEPPPSGGTEQQLPPPPPVSYIINTDSFVGSLLYAAFKAIFQ